MAIALVSVDVTKGMAAVVTSASSNDVAILNYTKSLDSAMDWCGTYSKDDAKTRNQARPADAGKTASSAKDDSSSSPEFDAYQEGRQDDGYRYGYDYRADANLENPNVDRYGDSSATEAAAVANENESNQADNESGIMESSAEQATPSATTGEDPSNYYRYKYGHFQGYYGENMDGSSSSSEPQNSTDAATSTGNTSTTASDEPLTTEADESKPDSGEMSPSTEAVEPTDKTSTTEESKAAEPAVDNTTNSSAGVDGGDYYGDYYRYKYGHLRGYYDENMDAQPANEPQNNSETVKSTEGDSTANYDETTTSENEVAPMTEAREPADSIEAKSEGTNYDTGDEPSTSPVVADHTDYMVGEAEGQYGREARYPQTEPTGTTENRAEGNYDDMDRTEPGRIDSDPDNPTAAEPSSTDESSDFSDSTKVTILSAVVAWASHSAEELGQSVVKISRQLGELDWGIAFLGSRLIGVPVR